MHAEIEFNYQLDDTVRKMDPDRYRKLRDAVPGLDLPEDPPGDKFNVAYDKRRQLIDLMVTGPKLVDLGVTFEVKRFKGTYKVADPGSAYHLHVAIPNLLLFSIDEVKVLEDACTDNLQDHLNDRWRILAVCPPACQRRPDYILGRQRRVEV